MMDRKTAPNTRGRIYGVFSQILEESRNGRSVLVFSDTINEEYASELFQEAYGQDIPSNIEWINMESTEYSRINTLIRYILPNTLIFHYIDRVSLDKINIGYRDYYEFPLNK